MVIGAVVSSEVVIHEIVNDVVISGIVISQLYCIKWYSDLLFNISSVAVCKYLECTYCINLSN